MSKIDQLTMKLEDDVNKAEVWVEGDEDASYTARDGEKVPSIRNLNKRAKINIDEAKDWANESKKSYEKSEESALKSKDYASGAMINSGVFTSVSEGTSKTKIGDLFLVAVNSRLNLYENINGSSSSLVLEDVTSIQDVDFFRKNSLLMKENRLENIQLNDLEESGIYRILSDGSATPENDFPDTPNASGVIEVVNTNNGIIFQRLTTWTGRFFWRSKYHTYAYQPWKEIVSGVDLNKAALFSPALPHKNIDNVLTRGVYRTGADADSTPENGFPNTPNASGLLEVFESSNLTKQVLTTWYNKTFIRTKYSEFPYQEWKEVVSDKDLMKASLFYPSLPDKNIDNILLRGVYGTFADNDSTIENGFPNVSNASGILEVTTSNNLVKQTLTTWYNRTFIRTKYGKYGFQQWKEIGRVDQLDKPYKDKTIVWIGDSIVAGNTHPEKVGVNIGAKEVIRVGFSSHTMSKYPGSPLGRDKVSMYRIADAINTGDWSGVIAGGEWIKENLNDDKMPMIDKLVAIDWGNVDYLVIAFGTNDIYSSTPLGTEYKADPNGETFLGAMCHSIEQIEKKYPHIKIRFITPTFRTRNFTTESSFDENRNSDTLPDPDGIPYIDYINAMKKSEEYYHLPVFDFYRQSGMNVRTFREYLRDGVHPNDNGIDLWVKKITAFMVSN